MQAFADDALLGSGDGGGGGVAGGGIAIVRGRGLKVAD
ncbi:hypothetical protein AZ22_1857, partial [Bordetella bronchiseptica 980-2]